MAVISIGSIGIDTIKTPRDLREDLLGGSASYAAMAASLLSPTGIVGVVGDDFPANARKQLEDQDIDLTGLEVIAGGETFRWFGEYLPDMNERETLSVDLNVLEHFSPKIPAVLREKFARPILLLANMSPEAQLKAIAECPDAKLIIADTMDLWIRIARTELDEVISKVDLMVMNDSEARLWSDDNSIFYAANKLHEKGADRFIIKRGEHGAVLFDYSSGKRKLFYAPAYPLRRAPDPTGAGDSFVGGLAGFLGKLKDSDAFSFAEIAAGVLIGSATASFTCEAFGVEKLVQISKDDVAKRVSELRLLVNPKGLKEELFEL